ncbi:DNA (cytosine-5-)-methyltransferase [Fusobacterium varium]|uniref:DNA (cytosine-5-)-methyltransferase n=1 Tax=Fusobacterium varium TaxID=856 RepID=UPI0032BF6C2B
MIKLNLKEKKALKNYTFIDLFAGIGGFRLGLESFGAKCIFSSEIDLDAIETYKMNYGECPRGDITQISEEEIPKHDILCAGFPCQPFSISGKMKGFEDTRGTLFFDIARIVKYHNPKILFLENVKNIVKHNGGETLKVIINTLENMGYNVYYEILNASDYGIPQARERVYIVCFKKNLGIVNFKFPIPINKKVKLKDFLEQDRDIEEFIIKRSDIVIRKKEIYETSNKPIRIGEISKGRQGERIYDIEGHAITLSADGGGVGAKTGLYLINGKIRRLTPNECRNIMGYPNTFKIISSVPKAHKQFGNSIVIDILQYILKEVIKYIHID